MNEFRAEFIAEMIVLNVLNKAREYRGLETRESNEFVKEVIQDAKEKLLRENNE